MQFIANDVHLLSSYPPYTANSYLVGDVLVDAGTRLGTQHLLAQIRSVKLYAHMVTHVHPDHIGASKAICETFGIPLWCSNREAKAMENADFSETLPLNPITWVISNLNVSEGYPVSRTLCEGDIVHDFTVIESPGHSPGHLSLWRERDAILIMGDVLNNLNMIFMREGLQEPRKIYSIDLQQNRDSARKLAALKPRIVCFGHGKPLEGHIVVDFIRKIL